MAVVREAREAVRELVARDLARARELERVAETVASRDGFAAPAAQMERAEIVLMIRGRAAFWVRQAEALQRRAGELAGEGSS